MDSLPSTMVWAKTANLASALQGIIALLFPYAEGEVTVEANGQTVVTMKRRDVKPTRVRYRGELVYHDRKWSRFFTPSLSMDLYYGRPF